MSSEVIEQSYLAEAYLDARPACNFILKVKGYCHDVSIHNTLGIEAQKSYVSSIQALASFNLVFSIFRLVRVASRVLWCTVTL